MQVSSESNNQSERKEIARVIIFVIAGLFLHMVVPMLLIGTVANIGLSTLFCLFTPHFLENR